MTPSRAQIARLLGIVLGITIALPMLGCGDSVTVILVNVDLRPTMRPADFLEVTSTNGEDTLIETFDIDSDDFPHSFSLTPTGRTGEVLLELRAYTLVGAAEEVQGSASATVTIEPDKRVEVSITLEPADFVVNSSAAGAQSLTSEPRSNGKQLTVLPDNTYMVAFLSDCANLAVCDVLARRFGVDTLPVPNGVSNDSGELQVNQNVSTTQPSSPAVASGAGGTLFTWATEDGQILGSLLDATTTLVAGDISFAGADPPNSAPHAAALADGTLIAVWREDDGGNGRIVGRTVDDRGNLGTVLAVSAIAGQPYQEPIAASTDDGGAFVVVWHDSSNVFARFFNSAGSPIAGQEINLTGYTGSQEVYGARVAWVGDAAMVVWGVLDEPQFPNGRLAMRRFATTGSGDGAELIVLDSTDSNPVNPALTARADGIVAIAWHRCEGSGDDSGCGIFMQAAHPSGLPIGDILLGNSTRTGNQQDASIAPANDAFLLAWTDDSKAKPDDNNLAVRARVVHPEIDIGNGKIGAPCGRNNDAACEAGLVCIAGSDDVPHCHKECVGGEAPECPSGGLCRLLDGNSGGCIF